MPRDNKETLQVADAILGILARHDMKLAGLAEFIDEHRASIVAEWTKRLDHRKILHTGKRSGAKC